MFLMRIRFLLLWFPIEFRTPFAEAEGCLSGSSGYRRPLELREGLMMGPGAVRTAVPAIEASLALRDHLHQLWPLYIISDCVRDLDP
jgi:hypothetical protein